MIPVFFLPFSKTIFNVCSSFKRSVVITLELINFLFKSAKIQFISSLKVCRNLRYNKMASLW